MKILIYIVLLAMFGCVPVSDDVILPYGTYFSLEEGSEERLEVNELTIFFHIKIANKFLDKKYHYTIWPDSKIIMPTNMASTEYFLGVGQYNWRWDGKDIIKEDVKTKCKVRFIKKNAGIR